MNFDLTSHQTLINTLTTVLVLVVGLLLVLSIIVNRLLPHMGSALVKTSINIGFPFSKSIDLEIAESDKPKRVILSFSKSVGYYNGKIVVKNGSLEVGNCELPVRPEYTNKTLKFYNEDVSRQTNVVIIRVRNCAVNQPLTLIFNLNQNVRDIDLKKRLSIADEDEIEIVISGRRGRSRV
jgi:hypothetical protein